MVGVFKVGFVGEVLGDKYSSRLTALGIAPRFVAAKRGAMPTRLNKNPRDQIRIVAASHNHYNPFVAIPHAKIVHAISFKGPFFPIGKIDSVDSCSKFPHRFFFVVVILLGM
jgi:hypothetical protein